MLWHSTLRVEQGNFKTQNGDKQQILVYFSSTGVEVPNLHAQTDYLDTHFINFRIHKDQLLESIDKKTGKLKWGTYCLARDSSCWGASMSFTSELSTFWTRRLYSLTFGVKTAKA